MMSISSYLAAVASSVCFSSRTKVISAVGVIGHSEKDEFQSLEEGIDR